MNNFSEEADGWHKILEKTKARYGKYSILGNHDYGDYWDWQSEAETFISPITSRETEILRYIAEGFLNKQIAAELGISEQTIKNHVTSILRKLNANARTEAVVIAIKQGLISLS